MEFRYLILAVLGFAAVIKLKSVALIATMFLGSMPVLIFMGYFWVRRIKKSLDVMNVEEATHYTKLGYSMQEETISLLKQILNKLP